MNPHTFLKTTSLPFCKGCGHHIVGINTQKALQTIEGLNPLDIIVVSDIGCIGIIDNQYEAHTFHGLHGRSPALAMGVALGLQKPGKLVLVYIGDGGATIGIAHLLEAAQRNAPIKVLVHNNMLYGMTGGQPSGLTPHGFKTAIEPDGKQMHGFDLCRLAHAAGAERVQRLTGIGDFSADLAAAFRTPGFSLVEIIELCPSYGVKFNPGTRPADIAARDGFEPLVLTNPSRPRLETVAPVAKPSLLSDDLVINRKHFVDPIAPFSVILADSAGEGVQSAVEFLAEAAVTCGLHVTKKGSYPITVGIGFSLGETKIQSEPITYS